MIRYSQLYGQLVFQKRNERIRQRKRELCKFLRKLHRRYIILADQGIYEYRKTNNFYVHFTTLSRSFYLFVIHFYIMGEEKNRRDWLSHRMLRWIGGLIKLIQYDNWIKF